MTLHLTTAPMTARRVRFAQPGAALFASLFSAGLLTGCPGPEGTGSDAGPEDDCGAAAACQDDRNCPGGFCDIAEGADTGCCIKVVCFTDADCEEGKICDVRRGICVPENLCNPGDNSNCPAEQLCVYEGGEPQCISAPPAAATCTVAAGGRPIDDGSGDLYPAVLAAGGELKLEATAKGADGKLIPHATFTWSGAGVSADGVLTGACAGPDPCDVTVTASAGGASCEGVVSVYPAPTAGSARIVLLDLSSGAPIAGATVSADLGGGLVDDVTDANGAAEFPGYTGAVASISAFPETHQWHTVLDAPQDVIIYTAELADDSQVAGVKGAFDFNSVSTQGDIKLGLAGTAIASAITDLNFNTIIGEIADYRIEIDGVTDEGGQIVPLPSGLVLELGNEKLKGDYVTFGNPGQNIAWAIGGKVRLSEVGPIISNVTSSDDINVGGILGAVLPFFARFDHAVVTDLGELSLSTRPTPPAEDQPVPYEDWNFPERTLTPDTLLSQSANYAIPNLPCTPGGGETPSCTLPGGLAADASPYATGAVLLSGTIVPGYGLIPLGLTAGLDDYDSDDGDDYDGRLSYDPETTGAPDEGKAIIDYAPAHDGLEGNVLVTVAIALDINSIAGDTSSFGASILTHITNAYGTGENSFPTGGFLESQGGTFSSAAGTFALNPVGDADFYRVNFDDGGDTEWNVWFSDPSTAIDVSTLAPAGVSVAGRTEHADVQAFELGAGYGAATGGPEPASFTDLFSFNGTNLDNLVYYLGGWASEACKPARIVGGTEYEAHCDDVDAAPVTEE